MYANKPEYFGGNYLGTGVQVSTIQRLQSDLIDTALRSSLTDHSYAAALASQAEQLDTLFADESTGLEPVLERFLNSAQDVASDPTSMSSRTVMLEESVSLAERFNSIARQLEEQRTLINGQIETSVAEINDYATALAKLNGQIVSGGSVGEMPNDLLDQRDNLLRKLAEKVDVSVTSQDNGALNVFIGTGQALVVNSTANELVVDNLSGDPVNPDIGVRSSVTGAVSKITRFISGGEIGGLVDARNDLLDRSQNELGLIALNIAESYNAQNRLGLDMDGQLGTDIFNMPEVTVNSNFLNDATGNPAVVIEEASAMTASDYRLIYDGTDYQLKRLSDDTNVTLIPEAAAAHNVANNETNDPEVEVTDPASFDSGGYTLNYNGTNYSLTRLSDSTVIALAPDPNDANVLIGEGMRIDTTELTSAINNDSWDISPTGAVTADGLRIDTSSITGAERGDNWLIQPTRNAASQLSVSMTDPADLAAAAAVKVEPSELNTGSAVIDSVRAIDTTDSATLFKEALVTYDEATTSYSVMTLEDVAGVDTWVAVSPTPSVSTKDGITTISANGWELTLSGTPDDQDRFIVSRNDTFEGDNRNMLAMSDIEDKQLIEGKTTIQGGYTDIIASVGTQTERAQILRDSSATLLESAQAKREALSGVNLDEEAADLIRYQQAYQASAQVINVARTLFDTILNAVG
ncbi:Flagellar hook-associated protein FlgK [Imhoffiella purpurea]|uniref:Flagellar hook-associated protein 1 n=1 Tax=Imhoffiella purpurea TaxID=1249627 RepID=W9VLE3_9GAMM|nr:Flagellar hook-associated protein FlgK [Imhoffiella purpurea]